MSLPQPEPWRPPAPSDHPEAADRPWPPNIPTVDQLAPPNGRKSNEPYCGNPAQNAFGNDFFQKLRDEQPNFKGNWWLLATLLRFEEAVRGNDRPDRFAWWNECIAQLRGHLLRANLSGARLHGLVLSHVDLNGAVLNEAEVHHTQLCDADLRNADFSGVWFYDVNGCRAKFDSSRANASPVRDASFTLCIFHHCSFRAVDLNRTVIDNTSLRGSQVHLARLSRVRLPDADLSNVKGLFGPNRAYAYDSGIEEHLTEAARFHRPWKIRKSIIGLADRVVGFLERHAANWERLRTIGQLRLFGVSYLAVIAIAGYTLLARWHNTRVVSSAHTAAERARQSGEDDMWATLLGSLPHLPTPAHLGYQLAATASLAIAATIYAIFCPNEVREATEVGWTRRMGQPLWEYRSAKWSRAPWRYLCLILFVAGGSYTLWYLLRRSGAALWYLLHGP